MALTALTVSSLFAMVGLLTLRPCRAFVPNASRNPPMIRVASSAVWLPLRCQSNLFTWNIPTLATAVPPNTTQHKSELYHSRLIFFEPKDTHSGCSSSLSPSSFFCLFRSTMDIQTGSETAAQHSHDPKDRPSAWLNASLATHPARVAVFFAAAFSQSSRTRRWSYTSRSVPISVT
nr:hypothetical protein L203_06502 [Cryptococcus depauperatus CBS 7841]